MTDQEKKLLEPTEKNTEEIYESSEIESESGSFNEDELNTDEGEIPVVDDEYIFQTGELEDVIYGDEDEDEDGQYVMDMGGLLSSVLATEDGDTVCSALVNISRQMEIQNKILIKMLSHMQKN
tara:strand:- start:120 stop:488 length:369 start_codon:yes stop_codon:yes gene_type:complete